jgi:hypothetical protein
MPKGIFTRKQRVDRLKILIGFNKTDIIFIDQYHKYIKNKNNLSKKKVDITKISRTALNNYVIHLKSTLKKEELIEISNILVWERNGLVEKNKTDK